MRVDVKKKKSIVCLAETGAGGAERLKTKMEIQG